MINIIFLELKVFINKKKYFYLFDFVEIDYYIVIFIGC